mgnify:CR=1 FL=1|tara:strand:+ start:1667 stop:1888 length:222 start_codon:yes stop_codon:yes gene_type:complete
MDAIDSTKLILSSVTLTQSMVLDDSNADTVPSNIVLEHSILTIDDSVTLTVEDNKTVIPDIYGVLSDRRVNNS